MCGITGFFPGPNQDKNLNKALLIKMGETLRHRGPNDSGVWFDGDLGVGLAHRRLSIIGFDLGCGSGRWAFFVAPKVAKLHCIDRSFIKAFTAAATAKYVLPVPAGPTPKLSSFNSMLLR